MLSALYAIPRPSVRLSDGWIIQKRLKIGSRHFHHTVAPFPYFLQDKFHPEISTGYPRAGAPKKGGVGKISYFLALSVNISKTTADTAKVTLLMTKRKSYMRFPLTPRSMTLDDLELL